MFMQSFGVCCRKKGICTYGSVRRLPKERFLFQLLLVDNPAVINSNETDILVFL